MGKDQKEAGLQAVRSEHIIGIDIMIKDPNGKGQDISMYFKGNPEKIELKISNKGRQIPLQDVLDHLDSNHCTKNFTNDFMIGSVVHPGIQVMVKSTD